MEKLKAHGGRGRGPRKEVEIQDDLMTALAVAIGGIAENYRRMADVVKGSRGQTLLCRAEGLEEAARLAGGMVRPQEEREAAALPEEPPASVRSGAA